MSDRDYSAIAWAREHAQAYRWHTILDNHEPPRSYTSGVLWEYQRPQDHGPAIVLETPTLRDAHHAIYLIDDGTRVRPFYVAGWDNAETYVILNAMPTNVSADGRPVLRADDGTPVDYGNWVLGPRRAYHLKVSEAVTLRFPNAPPVVGIGPAIVAQEG